VVAVIGAVLVYLWFAGYVTKATSQAEQMAASEKLKIEATKIDTGAGTATLYVRNLGGDKVTIATIYILRPGTINPLCEPTTPTSGATIDPGNLATVTFDFDVDDCDLQPGYDYVIKLVTLKGTEFAVTVTAS
jgi:archaellum component FlaG (FlaF/FlaG flagellin family)